MSENKVSAAKRFFSRYQNLVTILIGPKPTAFQVHEDVLTQSSDFFRQTLSSNFRGAVEKSIRLPEMDLASFTSYIHWAYTGAVKVRDDPEDEVVFGPRTDRELVGGIKSCLIKLYIAASTLISARLQNAAIDRLIALGISSNSIPGAQLVTLAYERTPEESKLRQFMVDSHSDFADLKWWKENGHELPREFVLDVLFSRMEGIGKIPVRDSVAAKFHEECKYHLHDEKLPKCSKGLPSPTESLLASRPASIL